jgi:hypothetical protein
MRQIDIARTVRTDAGSGEALRDWTLRLLETLAATRMLVAKQK